MRRRLLIATVTICAALVAAAVAPAKITELGTTLDQQTAACPQNCQAIGQVSGFQIQQGTRKMPYQVHTYGKVVAFTMKLGAPNASQQKFFNKLFGGPPQVMLTVLKPVAKQPNRYVLSGVSPVYNLQDYFGSEPTFALPRPLSTKPGYIIGITVPTWAPAFAVNLDNTMVWRSSRNAKSCNDVRQDAAHTVRASTRTYGCSYRTARLLYTASYIPNPKATTPPRKRTSGK